MQETKQEWLDSKQIRRSNIIKLMESKGISLTTLADSLGKHTSYMSRALKDNVSKEGRGVSDSLAREIEQKFGLNYGYLDNLHDADAFDGLSDQQHKIIEMIIAAEDDDLKGFDIVVETWLSR